MTDAEKILDEARQMKPDPPRSKLDYYAEIIWELRRKRKRICAIAAFLTGHGIPVGKSTVARWLKAHPSPKASAGNRPSSVTPEMKEFADIFFEKDSTNPKHE
jgi:hypothetical protein